MSLRNEMGKGPLSLADLDSSSASSSSGSIVPDKSGDGDNNDMIAFMNNDNQQHGSHNSSMLVDMVSVGSKGSKKYPCNVPNPLRRSNFSFRSNSPKPV